MLKNYLKIAFRNLLKNKGYTSINVLGLTLGMTAALIISLMIRYELDFDQFHSDKENIYRVVRTNTNASGTDLSANVPYPLGDGLTNELPDLADHITTVHYHSEDQVTAADKSSNEAHIIFADSSFFKIFGFKVLSGNPVQDLKEPGKVFITPTLAQKYYEDDTAIGKTLKLGGELELEVVGLLDESTPNSHLKINMIVSYPSFNNSMASGFDIKAWGINLSGYVYAKANDDLEKSEIEHSLNKLANTHYGDDESEEVSFNLQELNDIHFNTAYANGSIDAIDSNYIFILSCIGIFILIIACVNFVNMSTALATKRAKEVGMRRTLGASKSSLILHFMGETLIITLIALILALAVSERLLPYVSMFLEKTLVLDLFDNLILQVVIVGLIIFVTIAAGLYPSVILAGYQPIEALKIKVNTKKSKGSNLRLGLISLQFVISMIMIISTLVIAAQTSYFLNKPLGFDKELVITIPLMEQDSLKNATLKQRILTHSSIRNCSFAVGAPTSANDLNTDFTIDEHADGQEYDIALKMADIDYMDTYGLELAAGRWYDQHSSEQQLVVNETTARTMGYEPEEALGKYITIGINNISAPITGVLKDFHMISFHHEISPMVMFDFHRLYFEAGVKISSNNVPETIAFLKSQWKEVYPEYIFQYEFLDESIASTYESEQRTFTMFKIFAGISIFICCIGLFGLISFMANSKTKEVGIRKVLGASVNSILLLFTSDFIKIILIAFVIASPVVWYLLEGWLENFAYHIDLHPKYFAIGLISTILITALTVGAQSLKAATANPVNSLKDE